MRSSIIALEQDINEVYAMAQAIKPASEELASSSHDAIRLYLTIRRRFDYAALIVALYASFEQFVEDILTSYVQIIAGRDPYSSLPAKVTEKHLRKTADILARGDVEQPKYKGITQLQLVENLFRCLDGSTTYELNQVAITAHDRNIKFVELGSLLSLVGLSHNHACQADALVDWFQSEQGSTDGVRVNVPKSIVEKNLDNLVDRRNDVAHRGGNPSQRLGPEDMQALVTFVLALARSISTLFTAHYLRKFHVDTKNCVLLELRDGPYQQQKIWVVKHPKVRLHVQQPAFALSSSGFLARWGRVQSLRVEDVDHDVIGPDNPASEVGVRLDFPAPSSSELYVMLLEDDVIWPERM